VRCANDETIGLRSTVTEGGLARSGRRVVSTAAYLASPSGTAVGGLTAQNFRLNCESVALKKLLATTAAFSLSGPRST